MNIKNHPITEAELDSILDRASKAILGPWFIHYTDDACAANARYISNAPGSGRHDQKRGLAEDNPSQARSKTVIAITLLQNPLLCRAPLYNENADFIAQARTDVPRLVAEIKRLRGILQGIGLGGSEKI